MRRLLFAFIVGSCLVANFAHALEFKSIGATPVVSHALVGGRHRSSRPR